MNAGLICRLGIVIAVIAIVATNVRPKGTNINGFN